jgi:hypothetical protein
MFVVGAILVVWFGFRFLTSQARYSLEECVAAFEAAFPVTDALPENPDLRAAELDAVRADLQPRLRASGDAEARYVDVMFDVDRRGRIGRVTSVLVPDTDNPVLAWHGLRMCSELPPTACPIAQLEAHLLSFDAGNSEVWALVAANREARGELDGALEALQWAGRAPTSNAYWADTVALVDRVLAAHSALGPGRRVDEAFGRAAATVPNYDAITQLCRERAGTDGDWADACLSYGRALERQSLEVHGHAFGLGLQQVVAEATGEDARVSEIAVRRTRWESATNAAREEFSAVRAVMLRSEPGMLGTYLDTVRRDTEAVAMRRFVEEELDAVLEPIGLSACGPTILEP